MAKGAAGAPGLLTGLTETGFAGIVGAAETALAGAARAAGFGVVVVLAFTEPFVVFFVVFVVLFIFVQALIMMRPRKISGPAHPEQ